METFSTKIWAEACSGNEIAGLLKKMMNKATPSCIPVSGPGLSKIIMRAGGFTHYVIIAQ